MISNVWSALFSSKSFLFCEHPTFMTYQSLNEKLIILTARFLCVYSAINIYIHILLYYTHMWIRNAQMNLLRKMKLIPCTLIKCCTWSHISFFLPGTFLSYCSNSDWKKGARIERINKNICLRIKCTEERLGKAEGGWLAEILWRFYQQRNTYY